MLFVILKPTMKIADKTVKQILLDSKKLKKDEIESLEKAATHAKKSLQDIALKRGTITDEELTKWYAELTETPFVKIDPKTIDPILLNLVPERIAKRYNAVVFGEKDGVKQLAMDDPDDVQAVDFIEKQLGSKPALYMASKENISAALEMYSGGSTTEITEIISEDTEGETEAAEEVDEADLAEDSPIAQTVTLLIEYAIKAGASDIHIEPREGFLQVRYRVDGVLREAEKLPKKVQAALVSRIKILANLKIDEHRVPQDGRFKITHADKSFALRISTLPIADGEKVVIRLLDESNKARSLEELGFWGGALKTINDAITQPHGMVLVTGPTGSGKSTTLFSVLSLLNKETVNISTVEDPIEYKIVGANQTQVNPKAGMTFASGLRALLRQDPNIIMVGEIRDKETADMGVQASLTGHLVFSTLHTNNAATCLPRLLDMGVEPFLIASTVRSVIGQRLVRNICMECREAYKPDQAEIDEIKKIFKLNEGSSFSGIHKLEAIAQKEGIGKADKDLSTTEKTITRLYRHKDGGCDKCGGSGFRGRVGIYEVLGNSEPVQELIMKNSTSEELQEKAISEGMLTMQLDGLVKAFRGLTSVKEILRVTRE